MSEQPSGDKWQPDIEQWQAAFRALNDVLAARARASRKSSTFPQKAP